MKLVGTLAAFLLAVSASEMEAARPHLSYAQAQSYQHYRQRQNQMERKMTHAHRNALAQHQNRDAKNNTSSMAETKAEEFGFPHMDPSQFASTETTRDCKDGVCHVKRCLNGVCSNQHFERLHQGAPAGLSQKESMNQLGNEMEAQGEKVSQEATSVSKRLRDMKVFK